MAKKTYRAAVYVRLSKEDGDVADARKAESNSISNQKSLIMNFLKGREDIVPVSVFEDDGYTGSSFDRPGFRAMMAEIESGRINCCVVKDLSRFGREYITAGNYIQRVFPALGVRFIAVTDNVDTADPQSSVNEVVIPVKNLVNDAFCADTSVKIRSQLDAKRQQGEFVGNFCPYGYEKSPENHNLLVPDSFAADVVRDIFRWIKEGMSCGGISERLNGTGVKSPMEYKRDRGMKYTCNFKKNGRAKWSAVAVRRIATNPVYTGMLVQGRVSTPSHKVKKRIAREAAGLIAVRGTHEAIITEKDFETVQRLLATDMRRAPGRKGVYLLSGLCRCADCGAPMTRKASSKNGRQYVYYMCSDNKRFHTCTPHRIREDRLEKTVTGTLRSIVQGAVTREDIAKRLADGGTAEADRRKAAERMRANDEELAACGKMLAALYEDYREGTVDARDFAVIKKSLAQRIAAAEQAAARLAESGRDEEEARSRREKAAEELLKYGETETFDRAALVTLVRVAKVHEDGKVELVLDCDDGFAGLFSGLAGHADGTEERQVG